MYRAVVNTKAKAIFPQIKNSQYFGSGARLLAGRLIDTDSRGRQQYDCSQDSNLRSQRPTKPYSAISTSRAATEGTYKHGTF